MPTIFSMAHPLDEIYPVAVHDVSLHLMEDQSIQIVYASDTPSICMVYNNINGQHTVYRIRKIKYDEWVEACQKFQSVHSGLNISSKVN